MALKILADLDYSGEAGVNQVRLLQQAISCALAQQDWLEVRRLDNACAALVDKVIAANNSDSRALVLALSELKGVYSNLITGCQQKVASMAV